MNYRTFVRVWLNIVDDLNWWPGRHYMHTARHIPCQRPRRSMKNGRSFCFCIQLLSWFRSKAPLERKKKPAKRREKLTKIWCNKNSKNANRNENYVRFICIVCAEAIIISFLVMCDQQQSVSPLCVCGTWSLSTQTISFFGCHITFYGCVRYGTIYTISSVPDYCRVCHSIQTKSIFIYISAPRQKGKHGRQTAEREINLMMGTAAHKRIKIGGIKSVCCVQCEACERNDSDMMDAVFPFSWMNWRQKVTPLDVLISLCMRKVSFLSCRRVPPFVHVACWMLMQ